MEYNPLGSTDLLVSRLSYGASALGGVFRKIDESEGIKAVHVALENGINYIDVAPAYGGTRAETVLGKALAGIPRDRYFISTKVGKYTDPEDYAKNSFDYSRARIRASIDESSKRIGVDYFDIIHIHDIEYQGRRHVETALEQAVPALVELKKEGRIGAVSFGMYPIDLWHRVIDTIPIDAMLIHNHHCLHNTRALELVDTAKEKGIGMINASPFGSGLLTGREPPAWCPAGDAERRPFRRAAELCSERGTDIAKLALQFASGNPDIPTTMFSSANPASVVRNLRWIEEPLDMELLAEVQKLLAPVMNRDWDYDSRLPPGDR